eukprot:TRINITY_DN4018_c0_g1_i2.p1 TRINITY_DN4018_c0_g1~~TRINITY_DN4018_c0_g1_i2.p1  ORF type:complete len:937 (+),score=365.76 TRINITY_DN4018_c0_g1_i2:210-3020(+)
MISRYFESRDLSLSLSVLVAEANVDRSLDDRDVAQVLSVPPDWLSPAASAGNDHLGSEATRSPIDGLLEHVRVALYPHSKETRSTQTEERRGVHDPLEFRLRSVEKEFELTSSERRTERLDSLEERMRRFERSTKERYDKMLQQEIERIRQSEISAMRMEEKDRCDREISKFREDLERKYADRMAELQMRESDSCARMDRKMHEMEGQVHRSRQRVLDEMERLRIAEEQMEKRHAIAMSSVRLEEERVNERRSILDRDRTAFEEEREGFHRRCDERVEAEKRTIEKEFREKEARLDMDRAEMMRQKQKLDEREEQYALASGRIVDVSRENDALRVERDELRLAVQRIQGELEILRTKCTRYAESEAREQGLSRHRLEEVEQYRKEILALRTSIADEMNERKKAEIELARLRDSTHAMRDQHQKEVEEMEREIRKLRQSVSQIQRKADQERSSMQQESTLFRVKYDQEKEDWEERMEGKEMRLRSLQQEVEDLTALLDTMQRSRMLSSQQMIPTSSSSFMRHAAQSLPSRRRRSDAWASRPSAMHDKTPDDDDDSDPLLMVDEEGLDKEEGRRRRENMRRGEYRYYEDAGDDDSRHVRHGHHGVEKHAVVSDARDDDHDVERRAPNGGKSVSHPIDRRPKSASALPPPHDTRREKPVGEKKGHEPMGPGPEKKEERSIEGKEEIKEDDIHMIHEEKAHVPDASGGSSPSTAQPRPYDRTVSVDASVDVGHSSNEKHDHRQETQQPRSGSDSGEEHGKQSISGVESHKHDADVSTVIVKDIDVSDDGGEDEVSISEEEENVDGKQREDTLPSPDNPRESRTKTDEKKIAQGDRKVEDRKDDEHQTLEQPQSMLQSAPVHSSDLKIDREKKEETSGKLDELEHYKQIVLERREEEDRRSSTMKDDAASSGGSSFDAVDISNDSGGSGGVDVDIEEDDWL